MDYSEIPVGDIVICDVCNRLIDDMSEKGGSFIGSYAVCPVCTERILKNSSEEEKDGWRNQKGG